MALHAQNGIDTVLLSPQSVTNGATATANLDCAAADYATIRILFKAELNTDAVGPTISVLHCDTTVATSFATIVANRTTEDLTAAKEVRYEVDMRARKRYLRLAITPGTTTDDVITVAAIGTLLRNDADPVSTTAMGDDVVTIV